MTRFKEITTIILLIQLVLVQCQWFSHDPYNNYGYPYAAAPPPYYGAPWPNQPEEVETLATNPNQPNIIIIKDNDDKPTKKDKFRFEEILTLLLTTHLGRDRDRGREREAPPAPQSNQGNCECRCCNCGCCCCNNRNNQNENEKNNNGKSSNGNGGGTTMHITIVLPNNSVNKNDSK